MHLNVVNKSNLKIKRRWLIWIRTGCWGSWPAGDPEMSWRLTVMRVPIGISPCVCSCVSCDRWLSERFIAPSDANWPQSSDSVSSPVSTLHWPFPLPTGNWQLSTGCYRVDYLLPPILSAIISQLLRREPKMSDTNVSTFTYQSDWQRMFIN